jgi:hypothetical protein
MACCCYATLLLCLEYRFEVDNKKKSKGGEEGGEDEDAEGDVDNEVDVKVCV